ncbi:MAG TPA: GNAT family N-acetyltransferase [Rectinemataceae bacterium]|nr:GNAT family N-acetyltransferase [Rectinemataceae bacterium]
MVSADAAACSAIVCSSEIGRRYGFRLEGMEATLLAALAAEGGLFVAEGWGAGEENLGGQSPDQAGAPALLGFAWIDPHGAFSTAPYLRLIAVDEAARGRQVGSALLAEFEARTARIGRDWCLLVSDFNLPAQAFYGRHGYAKAGALPDFARPGITEILMVKRRGRITP